MPTAAVSPGVSPTRRTYLSLLGALAVTGTLAGCTGAAPPTNDDDTDTDTDDGTGTPLPGTDEGGSGAGGTRPEGTGGPGVTIVSVDDAPDLPVRPGVELVRDTATADHPPRFRTTLTNTTDTPVQVGEGRAVHFAYVTDEADELVLLPAGEEYPAEPDCWRLTDGIAVTEEYQILEVAPDEPSTRLLDLYGTPGPDSCLPVGEYRFETTIAVVNDAGEQQQSATWGFVVSLE